MEFKFQRCSIDILTTDNLINFVITGRVSHVAECDGSSSRSSFRIIMVISAVMSMTMPSAHAQVTTPCPSGFANFGDSLTDTGNAADLFPYLLPSDFPPYGETFFGKPVKRFSNGRLVPDFFSEAFGVPLLDAYLSLASFNYVLGINFANAGSDAALTATALEPIGLAIQTNQFIRFLKSVSGTQAQVGCTNFNQRLPLLNPFPNWLYTIAAGSNDLLTPLLTGSATISQIKTTIVPQAVAGVIEAIVALYETGTRRFLVFGIPAGGCLPTTLTLVENFGTPKDNLNCSIVLNSVVQNFNTQLLSLIKVLRQALSGISIAFFDYLAAHTALLSNPTAYGFDPTKTKMACCGSGKGLYNFNPNVQCGSTAANNCTNPDQYVSWDGTHFTENFYRQIALNGEYTDGGINYVESCSLDFSKFPSGVTYQQAYPLMCNNLFT